MKYEYDVVTLQIDENQKQVLQLGLGDIEALNLMIKEVVNERAKDGWEPLYPFSVPQIWFRKPRRAAPRKKTRKTS
jgi:hypothetical protein